MDFSICTSATASVELCSPRGEVPWRIAIVNRRVLALSRAMTCTVIVLNVWGLGQEVRSSVAYSELVDVLSRATEKLSLDWPDEPRESQSSKLDEWLVSSPNSRSEWRKLPFFSDLHHEISRSWKQPFSSRLTNAAAADFTNLVGSVEQGYTAIPVVEDTLASHLSPSLASSWKSRPLLPTKPCRTTSALSGSPTSRLVRQAWPSTLWPSSKPTRLMFSKRWTKGLV